MVINIFIVKPQRVRPELDKGKNQKFTVNTVLDVSLHREYPAPNQH